MPRQTKYEKEGWADKLALIEGWARDGLTMEQIANNMGISKETLYQYRKKYPDFYDALKKGKEVIDYEVENALLEKALSGNVTAMIFWLKNRKPKQWRDNPQPEEGKNEGLKALAEALNRSRE